MRSCPRDASLIVTSWSGAQGPWASATRSRRTRSCERSWPKTRGTTCASGTCSTSASASGQAPTCSRRAASRARNGLRSRPGKSDIAGSFTPALAIGRRCALRSAGPVWHVGVAGPGQGLAVSPQAIQRWRRIMKRRQERKKLIEEAERRRVRRMERTYGVKSSTLPPVRSHFLKGFRGPTVVQHETKLLPGGRSAAFMLHRAQLVSSPPCRRGRTFPAALDRARMQCVLFRLCVFSGTGICKTTVRDGWSAISTCPSLLPRTKPHCPAFAMTAPLSGASWRAQSIPVLQDHQKCVLTHLQC